jgi:hypothetical protein
MPKAKAKSRGGRNAPKHRSSKTGDGKLYMFLALILYFVSLEIVLAISACDLMVRWQRVLHCCFDLVALCFHLNICVARVALLCTLSFLSWRVSFSSFPHLVPIHIETDFFFFLPPLICAENAGAKPKKGSEKNPNKKKGKNPTRAEKMMAETFANVATPPACQVMKTPPANRRSRVPMKSMDENLVLKSLESPDMLAPSTNPFALLEGQTSTIKIALTPSPIKKVLAPTPTIRKMAIKNKAFKKRNFLDALAVFDDIQLLDFDLDVEAPAAAEPEDAVNSASPEGAVAAPEGNFLDALVFFEDCEFLLFDSEIESPAAVEPEVEASTVVVAAPEPAQQAEEENAREGLFIRAFRFFGKIVANVAAAAVAVAHVVRSCF